MKLRLLVVSCLLLLTSVNTHAQYDSLSIAFVEEVNAMRQDPRSFIDDVDAYVLEWKSFVRNPKELQKAANEIKKILRKLDPLPPFHVDSALQLAAADHAEDCKLMGVVGHIGSDGSNPQVRIERHGSFNNAAEVITYGQPTTMEMLAAFLVDHDSPSRGHRKSMLSTVLTHLGVVIDEHPKFRIQCVVDLGGN